MQIVILMAFVVAMTLIEAGFPPAIGGRWVLVPALVMYLAGAAAVGALRTALSLRAMDRRPGYLPGAFRLHRLMTVAGQAWLVAGLAGLVVVGYGHWVQKDLGLARVPLVGKALVVCPFVVALILNWLLEYPLYRAMRARIAQHQLALGQPTRRGWTFGEFLGYNLRHHLLFIAVPIGLILLLTDAFDLLYGYWPAGWAPAVTAGGSLLCALAVFLCAPLLIVRVWKTDRLPESPLRDELLALCRRLRLACRDLLVWRSAGMIANAGVMGLIGSVRYVLLSDALLEHMDRREIRSIFAHEAGHVIFHHLPYYLLFAVSSVTLCSTGGYFLADLAGQPGWVAEALTMGGLLVVWGLGFGWISRRFERQSDVTAAWLSGPGEPMPDGRITPEGAAVFARALERVAQLGGVSERQRNWRHGSIASRVQYVLWLGSTAGARREIDRTVRRIKIGLWVATLASAGAFFGLLGLEG